MSTDYSKSSDPDSAEQSPLGLATAIQVSEVAAQC